MKTFLLIKVKFLGKRAYKRCSTLLQLKNDVLWDGGGGGIMGDLAVAITVVVLQIFVVA